MYWWVVTGSNRRPSACKADALPAELTTHIIGWREFYIIKTICQTKTTRKELKYAVIWRRQNNDSR